MELSKRDDELLETQKALRTVISSIQAVGTGGGGQDEVNSVSSSYLVPLFLLSNLPFSFQAPSTVLSSGRKRERAASASLSSSCLSDPTLPLRTPTELAAPTEVKRPRVSTTPHNQSISPTINRQGARSSWFSCPSLRCTLQHFCSSSRPPSLS